MQFPIWIWVVLVVGVIAAGIGLGYLIIYLFWRIERYFSPKITVPQKVESEIEVEEPVPNEIKSDFSPEVAVLEKVESEIKIGESMQDAEDMFTDIKDAIPSKRNRLIKFTYILNSQFNRPFEKVDTIICWDITLKHGDEVRDSVGKQMKLHINRLEGEMERVRYTIADKSGHHIISVIPAKEYLERETRLNPDKLRMIW